MKKILDLNGGRIEPEFRKKEKKTIYREIKSMKREIKQIKKQFSEKMARKKIKLKNLKKEI